MEVEKTIKQIIATQSLWDYCQSHKPELQDYMDVVAFIENDPNNIKLYITMEFDDKSGKCFRLSLEDDNTIIDSDPFTEQIEGEGLMGYYLSCLNVIKNQQGGI